MPQLKIRHPHVAGQFYPAEAETLRSFVKQALGETSEKRTAKGLLVPHAGYVFSGETAGKTFASAELTPTVIVLCPNHTGLGPAFSLMAEGTWETPLGSVPVDSGFAAALLKESLLIDAEESAHRMEHAIEVELPFLQCLRKDLCLVPLVVGTVQAQKLRSVGESLAAVIERTRPALIVASGDMNHYEDERTTQAKDCLAIEAMLALDEERLAKAVRENHISMCGFGPAYIMLVAVKKLGATKALLIEHTTSGKKSGDLQRVVGYAGMIFS